MMPSPLGRQGGAPSEHPPSAMNRVSTVTDSASPYNAPSPALSFGGSISGPLPPTPPVPPSGFTARRPDDLEAGVNSISASVYWLSSSIGYSRIPFSTVCGGNDDHQQQQQLSFSTGCGGELFVSSDCTGGAHFGSRDSPIGNFVPLGTVGRGLGSQLHAE